MEQFRNLEELYAAVTQKFTEYDGGEFVLPESFKEQVKEIDNCTVVYYEHSAVINTKKGLSIFLPNQWFYIASYFTELYNELLKYKQAAVKVVSLERLKSLNGSSLSEDERQNIQNLPLDDISKSYLERFMTDYSWWNGAKTIDRGDFYVSPILNCAKLVNASQSYIADLCAFLADKKDLVNAIISSADETAVKYTVKQNSKALQQIYFGAPGTGKSFKIDSNENITEQNSVRTTFHPDSDYSTFVGCYKPVKRVAANKFSDISLKEFITMASEITGRPAGDKVGLIIDFVTKYAERLCQLVEEDESIKSLNYLLWNILGFSNETYLAKVIEKTIEERAANAEITYDFVPQAFTTAYIEAWKNLGSPYYLIIEEINRGNCAQIFGDIFQLLDRDSKTGVSSYKITPDKDLQNYIAEQLKGCNINTDIKTGAKMQLPSNLSILATMNTSDQSLFPIDSAFKRRWEWKYIPINYNDNKSVVVCGADMFSWNEFLSVVNQKIESVTQSEDKKLGAWFVKAEAGEISAEKFVSKVIFYLWNDIFKDFAHDGNSIFKEEYNKFHKFFDFTGEVDLTVLDKFLRSLGLTPTSGDDADDFEADYDDTISTSGKRNDDSLFSINGSGHYNKGEVAFEAVKMFADSHTDLSAQEVAKTWTNLNIPVSNLVLTEEQYVDKKSRSKENMQKFEKRFNQLNLSDGSIVYISKGFTIDTIMQFARIVNNKSEWGIHIDRVAQ